MKEPKTTQHPEDVLFRHVKTVHNLGSVVDAMEEYSDQQNAELREQLKETENSLDASTYNLKRVVKKCNTLTERVKELEGLLTIWVKQNNYLRRHSISDFDEVHDQTKKTLKK